MDSKLEEEKLSVKVHYTDKEWSSPCFDEWREACEIVDIPSCYTDNSEEEKAFFPRTTNIDHKGKPPRSTESGHSC